MGRLPQNRKCLSSSSSRSKTLGIARLAPERVGNVEEDKNGRKRRWESELLGTAAIWPHVQRKKRWKVATDMGDDGTTEEPRRDVANERPDAPRAHQINDSATGRFSSWIARLLFQRPSHERIPHVIQALPSSLSPCRIPSSFPWLSCVAGMSAGLAVPQRSATAEATTAKVPCALSSDGFFLCLQRADDKAHGGRERESM